MTTLLIRNATIKLQGRFLPTDVIDASQSLDLYRGMRDMTISDDSDFLCNGGAEKAPMSTTSSLACAMWFSTSANPMLLRLRTRGAQAGADISSLSVFPKECEFLYPPLTYLEPLPARRGAARKIWVFETWRSWAKSFVMPDTSKCYTVVDVVPHPSAH